MNKLVSSVLIGLSVQAAASTGNIPAVATDVVPLSNYEIPLSSLSSAAINGNSGTSIIDLVVFYEPEFKEHWGEQVADARINKWVKTSNQALTNSGIDAEFRIVYASSTYTIPADLPSQSILDEDGYVKERGAMSLLYAYIFNDYYSDHKEHQIFQDFGGDIALYARVYEDEVSLNSGEKVGGFAGIGGRMATVFDWQPLYSNKDTGAYITTHELGHLLGGNHEREKNSFPAQQKSYAVAYSCGGKNTAMWSALSEDNHLFYSSPDKEVNGEKCGVEIGQSDEADNTSVFKESVSVVAARSQAMTILGDVTFTKDTIFAESSDNQFTLELTRNGDLSQPASVEVAFKDGNALQGVDYLTESTRVYFDAGQEKATITIDLNADNVDESNFTAVLRYPHQLSVTSGESIVYLNTNGELPTGEITITSSSDVTINESESTEITFERVNGSAGQAVFDVIVTHSSTEDSDVLLSTTRIEMADGELTASLTLDAVDDANVENTESLSLTLQAVTPTDLVVDNTAISVTIKDNDVAPVEVIEKESKSSGGGSFGWALGLMLLGIFRSKQ